MPGEQRSDEPSFWHLDLWSLELAPLRGLRPEDCFHDLPRVHFLERLMPRFERPHAAKNRPDIELTGCEQRQHAFPNGPVVTETALERDVLLHERVEGESKRLRPPTH